MATIGLPQIDISFKQLGVSAITRSSKGVVCIGIKDDTKKTFTTKEYSDVTTLIKDKAFYTIDNYNSIMDAFTGNPLKVIVIRVDMEKTIADILTLANGISMNWFTTVSDAPADHNAVVIWEKQQNVIRNKAVKVITYKATTTDDMHCVNFINDSVKRKLDLASISGHLYLGRLVGIFAGLPFTQSATYLKLTDIESVVEPADVNAEIGSGNLVIINDEGNPRIGRAINSLVTITSGMTDSFKAITVIEALDLIREDIKTVFKNEYIGKFKNKLSNQLLFISSVNGYFNVLESEDILDDEFDNKAFINVDEMRIVWQSKGKDVSAMSDEQVMKLTIGSDIYAGGKVKVLDAIEGLKFDVTMN